MAFSSSTRAEISDAAPLSPGDNCRRGARASLRVWGRSQVSGETLPGMSPGGCHRGDVPGGTGGLCRPGGAVAGAALPVPRRDPPCRPGGREARPGDISRRRGLPASFFARCITSRRCHTPLPAPRRGAGAHGEPARRGQPRLGRTTLLLQVSGAGPGTAPGSEPEEPWGQPGSWGQPGPAAVPTAEPRSAEARGARSCCTGGDPARAE